MSLFFIMTKWADFLISEATYDNDHLISVAIRHKESVGGIGKGIPIDRLTIASDIKNGVYYCTIYNAKNSWKKGHNIHTFSISGNPYLRIDKNKVKLDYLGDLPDVSIKPELTRSQPQPESPRGSLPKESPTQLQEEEATPEQLARLEQLEKQLQELESQPQPESPRGSLPKESPTQLQEEEATPEQLARLEQLEKQLQELESQPQPESPRGSLPKESPTQLQEEEEEATPEQLDDIKKQLQELEHDLLSSPLPNSQHEEEATPEQLDDIKKQLQELEHILLKKNNIISNQIASISQSKINRLKPEIFLRENSSIDNKILHTLQKQNMKLDKIEKKISETNYEPLSSDKISTNAYCVKCKTKQEIINIEKILMKNGRPALKGDCSVCSCKVFRFVKIEKK